MGELDVTSLLIEEARSTGEKISDLVLADERILATSVSVLAAAGSIAVGSGKSYLLMAFPFAVATLFCFIEYIHVNLSALAGYKAVLEEAIEKRLGEVPVIAWESSIAPSIRGAKTGMVMHVLIWIFYFLTSYAALDQALRTTEVGHWGHRHANILLALTCASILVSLIAMAIARHTVRHVQESVEKTARDTLLEKWVQGAS